MAKRDVKNKLDNGFYRTSITLDRDTYKRLNKLHIERVAKDKLDLDIIDKVVNENARAWEVLAK